MSVGAGSIKRAAASAAKDTKPAAKKAVKSMDQSAVSDKAGEAYKSGEPLEKRQSRAGTKQGKKSCAASKKVSAEPVTEKKAPAISWKESSGYEAYGVGQQLPIYLL